MAPKISRKLTVDEAVPPTRDDCERDEDGKLIHDEEGLIVWTQDYANRREGWKADQKKMEQTDDDAKVELQESLAKFKRDDPEGYYLSAKATIAEGTKTIIQSVFDRWQAKHAKNGTKTTITVILSCRHGFLSIGENEVLTKAWKYWAEILEK